MKIDLNRFLGLTGLLAAPLVLAPASGCVIVADDDGDTTAGGTEGSASASASDSDSASNTDSASAGTDSASAGTDSASAGTDSASAGTDSATDSGTDSASAGTDSATDSGTDSADATGATGTDGTVPACCEPSFEPGCTEDPRIEACVCAMDPICCDEIWDQVCTTEVGQFGCGEECPVIDPTGE